MNLTLKIINGNRTSFHPVGSSPSVYRQPADADGRVAKVYDAREENMHEIFKGDEAYLINGYGKTIDIVYRPDQFWATRGSTWSDEALSRLLKDSGTNLGLWDCTSDHRNMTATGTGEMSEKQVDDSGNCFIEGLVTVNHRSITETGTGEMTEQRIVPNKAKTPGGIFHALQKRWESGGR